MSDYTALLGTEEFARRHLGSDDSMQKELLAALGLSSMEERARLIGAELRISSAPGHGTTIELRVPPEDAAQRG